MKNSPCLPSCSPPSAPVSLRFVFPATILLSAFLLFQVQPLISKFILPWFGGSPAVWTTCMLFFQTLLFGGYLYSHLSEHVLSPRLRMVVHLGLLGLALAMLPIMPSADWKPADSSDPTGRILGLLTVSVGIPYFLLSSTGPLIQSWFSRACPGRSPYRLYALSNFGSLAALLSYPFVFEPRWTVQTQALFWSGGFVLFALLSGYAAVRVHRVACAAPPEIPAFGGEGNPAVPTWKNYLMWLALPALASLMLLATTNHICQNVAVIPFLWIVPLSLYLLTFIISFDHPRWYRRGLYSVVTAILVLLTVADDEWFISLKFPLSLLVYFAAMFGICMLCHGELVRLRPAPRHLTVFYLMIAAGGALGGMLVSLVAPHVFTTFLEWKIGLAAGYLLAALLTAAAIRSFGLGRGRLAVIASAVPLLGLTPILYWQSDTGRPRLERARNFYGVVSVLERAQDRPLDHDLALFSGAIIHGTQFVAESKRHFPTTYYGPESGVGRTLAHFRVRSQLHVGVVGLGAGTLAAHGQSGHRFRFYEINPEMLRLANQPFAYLSDCQASYEVVLGDARLSLEREPPQQFDVLVLDAFSGDAIPAHLLTAEAFAVYQRHLKPDGVLCVHVTNTYLDLPPVVQRLADHCGFETALIASMDNEEWDLEDAQWMLLSKDRRFMAEMRRHADPFPTKPCSLWTDSYSNLFEILKTR